MGKDPVGRVHIGQGASGKSFWFLGCWYKANITTFQFICTGKELEASEFPFVDPSYTWPDVWQITKYEKL